MDRGRKTDGRRQRSEDGWQTTEVLEFGSGNAECGMKGQRAEDG
jgi:hypothetical protein